MRPQSKPAEHAGLHRSSILTGDALAMLKTLPSGSYDAAFCDPPYGLSFMGKAWDHGVPSSETWAELLRVLKPGAFLLAFGGTRTHHRLMCAIEDAGFEIRDCLMWIHGQGFPKSLDIGKAIDKQAGAQRAIVGTQNVKDIRRNVERDRELGHANGQPKYGPGTPATRIDHAITAPSTDAAKLWDGYGTALKPAYEPIILAMKTCEGTFAENALKHGVAGLAIDAGRIGTESTRRTSYARMTSKGADGGAFGNQDHQYERRETAITCGSPLGRWPANVILDEESARLLDEQSGKLTSGTWNGNRNTAKTKHVFGAYEFAAETGTVGSYGGASRFFYCAKASRPERGDGNTHPTVKPLKLCEYLARLILPANPKAKLLVPFSGSGSECIGAMRAGWKHITGIEREAEYVKIARRRMGSRSSPACSPKKMTKAA